MDKYRNFFEQYTAQFDMSEQAIKYKHDHTLRVAEICKKIAQSLKMSYHDIELAELIGLFHDLGRFKQWTKYETFNDIVSCNHAKLSVKILQENHALDGWEEKDLVLAAVDNHNKFEIDPAIHDERTIRFCEIIRDADKLDILCSVINGYIPHKRIEAHGDTYHHAVIECIKNHQPINHKICQNDADRSLNKLGLLFDINFDYTKDCIRQDKIIQNLIDLYINHNPGQDDLFRQLKKYIMEVY